MFGIGGWEFVFIVILALLLFGPDKLPQLARTVGRFMRDFKRYQDLMEATIRSEMFAADPSLRKDAFETAKEFRKKVSGSGFEEPEQPAEDESAGAAPHPNAAEEPTVPAPAEPEEPISAMPGEIAEDDAGQPESDNEGEGERGEP